MARSSDAVLRRSAKKSAASSSFNFYLMAVATSVFALLVFFIIVKDYLEQTVAKPDNHLQPHIDISSILKSVPSSDDIQQIRAQIDSLKALLDSKSSQIDEMYGKNGVIQESFDLNLKRLSKLEDTLATLSNRNENAELEADIQSIRESLTLFEKASKVLNVIDLIIRLPASS